MTLITDGEILDLFEMWYEREMPRLFRYVYYRVRDNGLAEELTATVCERALSRLHQYDPERGEFKAWMFGIARNEINYHLRSQMNKPALVSLDALPGVRMRERPVEADLQIKEALSEVLQKLPALAKNDQELIALRYGAGLSNGEIAEMTGITPNYVRVRLHRALKKLRRALEQEVELV